MELAIEAGLPKGVVNVVTCSRNEADLLLEHPDIRGISFVGSTAVGKHIYSTAAAHGKRVQCLTEAKNHALVMRDAELDLAAQRIINSTYGCAGMRCMALPVLVIEDCVADEFLSFFKHYAERLTIGCAYDPLTELGPVVSAEHKQFIIDWIDTDGDSARHLYTVRVDPAEIRDKVIEALKADNIGTSVHFIPAHHHPFYQERLGCKEGDYPNATRLYRGAISLPLFPAMREEEVGAVVRSLARAVEECRR